jgi:short-subunit dehydrogenase
MAETVFITGGSSGIGAEMARQYSRRGASVGLVGRSEDKLKAVADSLTGPSAVYAAQVADLPAMQHAAKDFVARFGVPDIVVANAGIGAGVRTEDARDFAVFREIMDTNVLGLVATFQPFIAGMRERGSGILAGVASMAGLRGIRGHGAYSASKAAAIAYLESLRNEMKPDGIAVVTIAPGYIDTPMTQSNPYPMPFMLPVEVAAAKFIAAIDHRTSFAIYPWQFALMAPLYRMLPNFLFDRAMKKAPRKPTRAHS